MMQIVKISLGSVIDGSKTDLDTFGKMSNSKDMDLPNSLSFDFS